MIWLLNRLHDGFNIWVYVSDTIIIRVGFRLSYVVEYLGFDMT